MPTRSLGYPARMTSTQRVVDVVAVLSGRRTVAEVAQAHGVSEADVEAWRALYVSGLEHASSGARRLGRPPQRWVGLAGAALVAVLASGWAYAQSSACTQTLPSPLVTLCADQPARATDVNGNLQQLVDWVQQKVGTVGTANVAITGTLNVTGTTTLGTTTAGATTTGNLTTNGTATMTGRVIAPSWSPPYAAWDSHPQGAGGAAIVNDNGAFKALMVVGNNSGNGSTRVVQLYDNVFVSGRLTFGGGTRTHISTIEPSHNTSWGSWSSMAFCPVNTYLCGLAALTEGSQGGGDDSAMNAVQGACCSLGP